MTKNIQRFWEIDLLRGIAIVLMIIYNTLYDLNYFNIYKIDFHSGIFQIYTYGVAIFFILVGISLSLSYSRAKKNLTKKQLQFKFLKRGLKIFGLGLLITLVTWIYLNDGFVVFGVLHCIGISIILVYPFLQFHYKNLLLGITFILVGILLKTLTFDFYWLVWLGFSPSQFYTVDYFPLIPWFGVVLIGIFIGKNLYPDYKRRFNLKDLSNYKIVAKLSFLGCHSLIIYLVHQPIIIALIHLFLL